MWTFVWVCTTVGVVPLLRTLLGGLDCRDRGSVWSWDRDSTSEYNLLSEEEQAAKVLGGDTLYVGDHPCYQGLHLAVYVAVAACRLADPMFAFLMRFDRAGS